ncbi:hypothetical protein EJB05_11326, partial [Eragrostis curvula]
MCLEDLSGAAYGCGAGCDFAIHESCAAHPQTYYSPSHPPHSLVLLQTRRDVAHGCAICAGRCAPGAFLYCCPPCGFHLHPSCAQLPPAVRSKRHPSHDLTLVVADGRCAACHLGAGHAWYYRCSACNVDLHDSCAAGGDGNNTGARHDWNSHVPAGDAQAAERDIQAALVRANMQARGRSAALDLLTTEPSLNYF